MKVKVAKWGNSLGVRLPKAAAESAGVSVGSEFELTIDSGELRLSKPVKTSAQRLQELLDQIDPNNVPETVDWGPDVGAEIIDDDYSRGLIVPGPDGTPVRIAPSSEHSSQKRDARSRRR